MRRAIIGHVSVGLTPWDTDKVKAELDKRGLTGRADTGGKGDIHDVAAKYKSYHTTTPDGFDLQITGFGRMDTYHAPNEFAELSHMHDGFRILCHVVEKFG